MRRVIPVCVLALAGCGQRMPEVPEAPPAPQTAAAAGAPVLPALAELSPRELLLECAGAIVAQADLDPLADPSLGTKEEDTYFTVLALMDKEPGLAGLAGREAAAASRDIWLRRGAELLATRAGQCLVRFGG